MNSTHVAETRNVGSRRRCSRCAPGRTTGITRNERDLSEILREIAARISSFCHGPRPEGPMNTAHDSDFSRASSSAGCHGSPGIRCHMSRKHVMPSFSRRRASSSTAGLSDELWDKNVWYKSLCLFSCSNHRLLSLMPGGSVRVAATPRSNASSGPATNRTTNAEQRLHAWTRKLTNSCLLEY